MVGEGRSSKKRKRAMRRGADKSQDIVVSGSSDATKSQRLSGSSSFLDKVRLIFKLISF